jgi:hypothetical protein
MSNRPNYYRLLELDPAEQRWPLIERRIEELKQRYNRVRTDAPKDQQRAAEAFKIFLNHPEHGIAKVMQDPGLRQAEAQARRQEIAAEEEKLRTMIGILQSRGSFFTAADVKEIAKVLTSVDEASVEARLTKSGLTKDDGSAAPKKPQPARKRPQLEEAEARSIESDLLGLHLESLYAFLGTGVTPRSSQKALAAVYQTQKEKLEKLVRGSPEHKVRNALLSHVKTFLLDDAARREKYNNYLADRDLRALDTLIKLSGGSDKTVTQQSLDQIIRDAQIPNVTADRIREYIEAWVERTKGWTMRVDPANPALLLLTCGFCGKRSQQPGQARCSQCGRPLSIACPNPKCSRSVPTEYERCPHCGCHTGDAPRIDQLLASAEQEYRNQRFGAASALILEALNLWPNYAKADQMLQNVELELQRIQRDEHLLQAERIRLEAERVAKKDRLDAERKAERQRWELQRQSELDHEKAREQKWNDIERARREMREDIIRAELTTERLKSTWPDDPDVRKLGAELEEFSLKTRLKSEIQHLCDTKQFCTASAKIARLNLDECPELRIRIGDSISRAEALFRDAQRFRNRGNIAAAIDKCDEVINDVVDFHPAHCLRLVLKQPDMRTAAEPIVTVTTAAPAGIDGHQPNRNSRRISARKLLAAISAVILFALTLTVATAWIATTPSELRSIVDLVTLQNAPEEAQARLRNWALDDPKKKMAHEFLMTEGLRRAEAAKRRPPARTDHDRRRSCDMFAEAQALFTLVGSLDSADGYKLAAECTLYRAQLFGQLREPDHVARQYQDAVRLFQAAAQRYSASRDQSSADVCRRHALDIQLLLANDGSRN